MKYIAPRVTGQPPDQSHGVAYDKAAEAAIEKKLSQYVALECDHLTTWEADEMYSVFRPDNRSHFCEICGRWRHRKPSPKYIVPDGDDLLF